MRSLAVEKNVSTVNWPRYCGSRSAFTAECVAAERRPIECADRTERPEGNGGGEDGVTGCLMEEGAVFGVQDEDERDEHGANAAVRRGGEGIRDDRDGVEDAEHDLQQ